MVAGAGGTAVLVTAGEVRYHEDVTVGLDRAPEAFVGMLRGDNLGKALITLS